MMLQPVSGWEIVTYWIVFVGFSLVIIALSISTAVRLNIVRVFLFADEWMSQWSLDTVGFCFGLVHTVSFSFFCHELSGLTKYLQCWSNTHSESCIESLSHLSPLTFVASRSGLTRYLLGILFWFLGKASSLCQNIWLISHKISLKMVLPCNRG